MAVVGRADVVVRALKGQLRRDIQDEFRGVERDADVSGQRVGTRLGDAMGKSASRRFIDGIDMNPLVQKAEAAGTRAGSNSGQNFVGRFTAAAQRLDHRVIFDRFEQNAGASGDRTGQSFIGRFSNKLKALDTGVIDGFMARIGNRVGMEGDRGGMGFHQGLMGWFERAGRDAESESANLAGAVQSNLSKIKIDLPDFGSDLASKIFALIPLIGVLGGGLAGLVGGLTAMAAAATYAAGALAGVATGVAALAGGFVTGFLALGGVFAALKQMSLVSAQAGRNALTSAKQQRASADAVAGAQDGLISARERVVRAEQELARTRRDVARQQITDERGVQDAERKLADAQNAARLAQRALTAAREDAKEKLEELQLQERGAVIGEEEATLRLRQARVAYTKTLNDSSATSDDKEQARLDLENAELSLDQAKDTREDVTKQTNAANKAGIEGSDQVVKAKQDIVSANRGVRDAEVAVTDARQKQRDDAVDGAQRIVDAQRNVADAVRAVAAAQRALAAAQTNAAEAAKGDTSAQEKLNQMLKRMSPQAAAFTQYLFGLRGEMSKLSEAAGRDLFGPLTISVKSIVGGFLPTFRQALVVTGGALGQFSLSIARALNVSAFKNNFAALARDNAPAIKKFGDILGNVLRGFTGLARAASPVFERFLDWVNKVTLSFAKKFEGEKNIKTMSKHISDMGVELAKIGHIFGQTFGIIGDIFKAALPSGKALNSSLLTTLTNFHKWTSDPNGGQKRMREFFERTAAVTRTVSKFLVVLVKEFLKLGEDKSGGLRKTFDALGRAIPPLAKGIIAFTSVVAPAMAHVIEQVVKAFEAFSKTKAFSIMAGAIEIIGKVLGAINSLFGGKLGAVAAILIGIAVAAGLLIKTLKAFFKVTGLKAITQTARVAIATPRSDRANAAKGSASILRGVLYGDDGLVPKNPKAEKEGYKDVNGIKRPPMPSDYRRTSRIGGAVGRRTGLDRLGPKLDSVFHPAKHPYFPKFDPKTDDELEYPIDKKEYENAVRRHKRANGPIRRFRSAFSRRTKAEGDSSGFLDVRAFAHKPGTMNLDESDPKSLAKAVDTINEHAKRPARRAAVRQHTANLKGGVKGSAKNVLGATVLETGFALASGNLKDASEAGQKVSEAFIASIQTEVEAKLVEHGFEGMSKLKESMAKKGEEAGEKAGAGLLTKFGLKMNALGTASKKGLTTLKDLGTQGLKAAASYIKLGAQAVIAAGRVVISTVAQKGAAAAAKAWTAVQWLLNAALDANPIALIVIGIAALVAGFILAYKHSATFRKIVQESLAAIGKAFKEMWDIAKAIFGFLKDHIQIVLLAFGPLGLAVSAVITVFKNWSKITDIVGKIFDDIVGFFTGLPGRIGSAVTGILGSIGSAGSRIGSAIWNGITGAFGSIVDFIKTPVNFILDAMRGMLKALGKIHLNIFGHKIGFPSDLAKYIPADIGDSPPASSSSSSNSGSNIGGTFHAAAAGATILPRPGGTLIQVAEAGRAESVVDTGLINARLRASLGGDSQVLTELSRQTDLLRRMVERVALNIENLNISASPDEKAEQSVPRTLRNLAYTMGT